MGSLGTSVRSRFSENTWSDMLLSGAIGGLLGGIVMGIVLQVGTDLIPVFGQVLGDQSVLYGWITHLITSVVFGLVFAWFVALPLVRSVHTSIGASILLGVIHASALSYVTIGVLLPLATLIPGVPDISLVDHLIPGANGDLFGAFAFGIGHVVYGIILGWVYGVLRGLGADHPEELVSP